MAGAKYPKKGGLGVPAALRSNVVGSRFGGGSPPPTFDYIAATLRACGAISRM